MSFAVPMVWREPKDHSSDCFCLTNINESTSKSKHTIKYPDLPSAMRPVSHSEYLPVPHPENVTFSDDDSDNEVIQEVENPFHDPNFEASTTYEPHLLTQGDLNDLVRDLILSKKQSELLGSRLKEWNLLHINTKLCFFRNRQDEFKFLFSRKIFSILCGCLLCTGGSGT
jgi:hypothetical protein